MKVQWVKPWKFSGCRGKFSGCPRARAPLSMIFPIRCNNDYYSEPSGWVKRSYVRIAMAFVSALCLSSTEGKSDAPTHLLFGSSFLFYFICYYASVSYFLIWSNWIDEWIQKNIRRSSRNVFSVQCKMFSLSRQCFSLTFMKAILHTHEREMLACYFLFFLS